MFSKHKSQIINCCKTVSRILPTTSSYRTNLIMTSADKYSVAICQMTSTSDLKSNLKICEDLIKTAKQQGASMAFLPEACDFIADGSDEILSLSRMYYEFTLPTFKELARSNDIWLSLGGIHQPWTAKKVRNTHLIINNKGAVVGQYNKVHVYDATLSTVLLESKYVEKGDAIVRPIKTPVGNVGLAICYDVRFPEVGISLTEMGADILAYPSAFTFETGSQHWEILLRCRAIENQRYVIAAGQTGIHNEKRRSWGHSMVVDPFGNICAQCPDGNNVATVEIDLQLAKTAFNRNPVYSHKRYDLYPRMVVSTVPEHIAGPYQFGPVSIDAVMVFYKTRLSAAFVNKRCMVPGHVLVMPLRCVGRLVDLSAAEVSDMFLTVQRVQMVMEQIHNTSSSTIVVQDGPDAGQTIPHVHVHILPRKQGDFNDNDDIYRVLQKHDKPGSPMEVPPRNDKEMTEESEFLRGFFL